MVEIALRPKETRIGDQLVDIPTNQGTNLKGRLMKPPMERGKLPGVLLVHGAAAGFDPLPFFQDFQMMLRSEGFTSLAVNLSGVGESSGNYFEQSINSRVEDITDAWKCLQRLGVDNERMALLTGSLNGHVAAKLTQTVDIPALVLYEPAVYPKAAEATHFGPKFSAIIRNPDKKLLDSPAFDYLSTYKGRLFTTYGTTDPVIPKDIRDKYFSLSHEYLSLGGVNHALLGNPLMDTPGSGFRKSLYRSTIAFLNGNLPR